MSRSTLTTVEFDAVVGFVDLAGFTAATERFGGLGARGTEELSRLINTLFTPAIDAIHRAGGEVGWFAGDAIGVVFDREATDDHTALGAMASASRLVSSLSPTQTSLGEVELGVKVGVAAGPVRWNTLRRPDALSWFSGSAVDLSAAAEHYAVAGDVIVHESVRAGLSLAAFEPVDPVASEFLRLVPNAGIDVRDVNERPLAARGGPDHRPARVARVAAAGDEALLDQHRSGTSVFLGLGTPWIDAEVLARVDTIVAGLGGYVATAMEGDKGAVLLALFGVPTALADRQRRAIVAANLVRAEFPEVATGIASGRLFAGRVGSHDRWDYSVLGDRVNTAARLMQAARPGEILLDAATIGGVGPGAVCGPARELELKGKAELEAVTPLIDISEQLEEANGSGPFVGREADTAALVDALDRPGVTLLIGAAGIGKSRLVDRVIGQEDRVRVAMTEADRVGALRLWRRVLEAVGINGSNGAEPIVGSERALLVDLLLGRPVSVTLLDGVEDDDRAEVLAAVVAEVLRASTVRSIVVEDLHWADAASIDLVARLVRRFRDGGISLLATSRPEAHSEAAAEATGVARLELGALTDDALAELAAALWAESLGGPPEPSLLAELVDRSAGSPLFCEQLVSLAQARGERADLAHLGDDMPTEIDELILARLDAIPAEAESVVGYGSVVSEPFASSELQHLFGGRPGGDLIEGAVEILLDRSVFVGFGRHRFGHGRLREIAHERLSFELRSELHGTALADLEARGELDMSELARHAAETDDLDRQRRYFAGAAEHAAARYANDLARSWYQRLLPIAEPPESAGVRLALGRIEFVAGELDAASVLLSDAIREAEGADAHEARLLLGRTEIALGDSAGFERIDAVIEAAIAATDWPLAREAMEVAADVATMLGEIDRAEAIETLQLELGERLGADHEIAQPLRYLSGLIWMRGDLRAAVTHYEAEFDRCLTSGDLVYAGLFAADLGGINHQLGDLGAALGWLERGQECFERIGHERAIVRCVQSNEAFIRADLGDRVGARRVGLAAARRALDLGDLPTVAGVLVAVAAAADSHDEAMRLLDGAEAAAERLGADAMLAEIELSRARSHARFGRFRTAIELLALRADHAEDLEVRVDLAEWRLRDGEDAAAAEDALHLLRTAGAPESLLFRVADALATIAPSGARHAAARVLAETTTAAGPPPALRERLEEYVDALPGRSTLPPATGDGEIDVERLLRSLERSLPPRSRVLMP